MVFEAFLEIISEYSRLEIDKLKEDLTLGSRIIDEIREMIENKSATLQQINQVIETLTSSIEESKVVCERLDVDLIRARTKMKKFDKNIGKLKSLNATNAKIEIRTNDQAKLDEMQTKLNLTRGPLKTHLTSNDKGFSIQPHSLDVNFFELSKTNSKQKNRVNLWKSIGKCSFNTDKWDQLL